MSLKYMGCAGFCRHGVYENTCNVCVLERENEQLKERARSQNEEIDRLNQWIHDCQSGMYINCVYCGFRYGPKDEVAPTMQQALYDHIAACPKHPLSKSNAQIAQLKGVLRSLVLDVDAMGIALFGDSQAWREAKAQWWVDLVESYNRAIEVLEEK